MTQARSGSAGLRLQLTPMLQPEAVPITVGDQGTLTLEPRQARSSTDLLAHPGETSEMVLQVKNLMPRPQYIRLEIKGTLPDEWCRWTMEGHEVLPEQEMLIGVYVDVPADFFEDQAALLEQEHLNLDYQIALYLYYRDLGAHPERRETLSFNVYVRPRSLYQRFLPSLYREVDLMGRLLKIFEEAFEPSVHALRSLWAYLDPLTSSVELLPFLAHWVGWQMVPYLDTATQRLLIRNAVQVYTWRGTRWGLRFYLHLYTGLPLDEEIDQESEKHISIEEPYGPGFILGEAHLGRETVLGGGQAFHFVVRLRPDFYHEIDGQLVRQIIEQEKPAFCTYDLYIDEPQLSG